MTFFCLYTFLLGVRHYSTVKRMSPYVPFYIPGHTALLVNEENRYCPLCTKKGLFLIENEFHLIVKCEYYATLRNT